MYYKIFIFICFYTFTAQAQAPGYMGKRFNIGYGFYTSPILFESNAKGKSLLGGGNLDNYGDTKTNTENGNFVLNTQHELFVEYALKKRWVLGFSARFYKTTSGNYNRVYVNQNYYDPNIGYTVNYSASGYPNGLIHIKGTNYSIYAKRFRKIYSAPWGRYSMFGLNIRRSTSTYDPKEMYIKDNYNGQFNNFGDLKQKYTKFDIMIGYGRTRIFFDRMTVDYGLNLNVISFISTQYLIRNIFFDNGGKDYTPENYIEKNSAIRLKGVNKLNVFCKIGFLLF